MNKTFIKNIWGSLALGLAVVVLSGCGDDGDGGQQEQFQNTGTKNKQSPSQTISNFGLEGVWYITGDAFQGMGEYNTTVRRRGKKSSYCEDHPNGICSGTKTSESNHSETASYIEFDSEGVKEIGYIVGNRHDRIDITRQNLVQNKDGKIEMSITVADIEEPREKIERRFELELDVDNSDYLYIRPRSDRIFSGRYHHDYVKRGSDGFSLEYVAKKANADLP